MPRTRLIPLQVNKISQADYLLGSPDHTPNTIRETMCSSITVDI